MYNFNHDNASVAATEAPITQRKLFKFNCRGKSPMLPEGTTRRRCVVLADGSAIGCYQRRAHETHVVVLEPSGLAYSYIRPNGTRSRHLTPTALSAHRALVVDTLALRNRFSGRPPYLHWRLLQTRDVRRRRRVGAMRARWPATRSRLKVARLLNGESRCFEMQSIEGTAKVRLNLSGTLVDVFCSVEVKMSDEDEQESSHAHFGTLQQTFSVAQTPPTFELPVRTLLAAKAAWDKDREAEIEYVGEGEERSMTISELPRNGAFTARPVFSVIAASSDGAETSGEENDSLALAEILRVATLPSKFLYRRVVAEVIGEATTILVSRSSENLLPDIVVQLDCERSVLTGSDGFFTWYDEAGHRAHRFTRETIPPPSIVDFQSTSDSVASICQHIDYLLQAFKYADPPLSQGSTLSSSSVQEDLELVEEVENEQGRFRAYRGGRVRVAFTDRTILQVERDGECCSFFFADGSTGKTTLSAAPLRHRAYIYQALEFGDWAFASQEERMQRHVKRQEAQAVVARELQRINVRCGMNKEFDVRYQQCISKDTSDSFVGQLMEQAQVKQIDRADPSLAMSLTAVQELQQATQQHIASVDQALRAAASATANDTQRHQ